MRMFIMIFLVFFAINSHASIYEQENNDSVSYSDMPSTQSKPIAPSETSGTISTQSTAPNNNDVIATIDTAKKPYSVFYIESPKNQETIQNQPVIPVVLKVVPELQAGDKIQLILDNKIIGKSVTGTQLTLNEVERGSHLLYAVLLDANNRTLKQSEAITIYVHKTSILLPPGGR